MAKYHDLVEFYSKEIKEIKAMMASVDEKLAEIKGIEAEYNEYGDNVNEHYAHTAWEQYNEIQSALYAKLDDLSQEIEVEYYDVPFKATRQAGIEGFWRESGIELN